MNIPPPGSSVRVAGSALAMPARGIETEKETHPC